MSPTAKSAWLTCCDVDVVDSKAAALGQVATSNVLPYAPASLATNVALPAAPPEA